MKTNGSRNRAEAGRRAVLAGAAALAVLVAACLGDPAAQGQEPLELLPPGFEGPEEEAPSERTAPDEMRSRSGIEIDSLETLQPDGIGPLDSGEGGLGLDMWRGMSRPRVVRGLESMPENLVSPTLNDLELRLLLTNARPPGEGATGASDRSLLTLRAEKLTRLGDHEGVARLMELAPDPQRSETDDRLFSESLFALGDIDGACGIVRRHLEKPTEAPYWRRAMVLCHDRAGEVEEANLAFDLLRESGDADDATGELLAALLADRAPPPFEDAETTPLDLAIGRELERAFADVEVEAKRPLLVAVARYPHASAELRARTGERAIELGLLPAAALGEVYRHAGGEDGPAGEALLEAAREAPDTAIRARLWQALSEGPEDPGHFLAALLRSARGGGPYGAVTSALRSRLLEQAPSPDVESEDAAEIATALYYLNEIEAADRWLAAPGDRASARVGLYGRLAGSGAALADPDPRDLLTATSAEEERRLQVGIARFAHSLEALNQPVPQSLAAIASASGPGSGGRDVGPGISRLMEASSAGHVGETVLIALLQLSDGGHAGPDPFTLRATVTALRRIGLEREARRLAIEAVMASGL